MEADRVLKVKKKTGVRKPKIYAVILHNDDFTPMDFVVMLLKQIFGKPAVEAYELMRCIHEEGSGIAGRYAYDIAVTKIAQSTILSRRHGHPLKCSLEEEA